MDVPEEHEVLAERRNGLTPIERIIELRIANSGTTLTAGKKTALEILLSRIDVPPRLPGLVKIAGNLLEILDPKLGVPVPEIESDNLAGWHEELNWIVQNAGKIAQKLFPAKRDREKFLCFDGDNPVIYQGAMSSPLYCQLWETHPDQQCNRGFRILQGQFMFAYFAVARRIDSAEWRESAEHARVASKHIYQTSLPLKHIARYPIEDSSWGKYKKLLQSMPSKYARDAFSDALWKFRNKNTEKGSALSKDLATIVRLLDWSLSGSYSPEPRKSADPDSNIGKLAVPEELDWHERPNEGSRPGSSSRDSNSTSANRSKASGSDSNPAPTFDITEDLEENDDFEESESEADEQDKVSGYRAAGITRYSRSEHDPKLIDQIIGTGDNPGKYLQKPSIHLAKNDKGVRLQAGGWVEMRNQYLPWSLNELADEELADAWLRLEEHARTGDPESIEIFALANTLLWTGRMPKHLLQLEIVIEGNDPSGDFGFFLPDETSALSAAEWRLRALPIPLTEPLMAPVHKKGARLSVPFFSLPDYAGTEDILRRHVALQPTEHSTQSDLRIFRGSIRDYEALLRNRLAVEPNHRPPNRLKRVTLARLGHSLFQRILDLTGGDLVAASLITGRDVTIARDDRFYAAPSITSLRKIYRQAVRSIREELVALRCRLKNMKCLNRKPAELQWEAQSARRKRL